jgi:DNA-binding transcriptional LysR family regulator
MEDHPTLNIEVVLDDRDVDLIEAGIDVALRIGRLADSSLTVRKIGQIQRRVIGTPAYFKAKGIPQTPADLVKHQAVVYDQRGGGTAWTFKRGAAEISVAVDGRVRVTAAEGVRAGVLAGLGLVIASEWMFTPELRSGAVKSVLGDWQLPPVDLWAVFPTGRQPNAKARAFASYIEKQISKAKSGYSNGPQPADG